jgi:hypothetical protein
MKIFVWITVQIVIMLESALGQGRVSFNNGVPDLSPVTISTVSGMFNPSDGPPGAFVGSSYSVSLVFVNGTVTSQTAFDNLGPIWVADALFAGTTGNGADGAGFFDAGTPQLRGQTDLYVTVQLRAWFNGNGAYTSYTQSLAAGHNVGISKLLPLYAPAPPGPAVTLDGLQPFTVGIPEPSSASLILIAIVSLTIFRRLRKPIE